MTTRVGVNGFWRTGPAFKAGARTGLIPVPGTGADLTVIRGVNEREHDPARRGTEAGYTAGWPIWPRPSVVGSQE